MPHRGRGFHCGPEGTRVTLTAEALPDNELERQAPPPWSPAVAFARPEFWGQPGNLRGVLLAPLPGLALAGHLALLMLGPPPQWPTLGTQGAEVLWLLWAPFWIATLAHAMWRSISDLRWLQSRGLRHIDWSPRRSHYVASFVLAAIPLVVVQWHEKALDLYLWVVWNSHQWGIFQGPSHVGYTPGWQNLWVLLAGLAVGWQASRHILQIPPGRLMGLQRELARLRGEVTWGPEAWGSAVGEAVDRWLSDLIPGAGAPPSPGASRWQQRQRWARLRREIIAAWVCSPPDLVRANLAIENYRRRQRR